MGKKKGSFSKDFIENAKNEYRKIDKVCCPVFGNEPVYFTKAGFNHLIRKGRVPRQKSDIFRRLKLLPLAVLIIKTARETNDYEQDDNGVVLAHFWSISGYMENRNIKVIVRKFENGQKHFFSVMDE